MVSNFPTSGNAKSKGDNAQGKLEKCAYPPCGSTAFQDHLCKGHLELAKFMVWAFPMMKVSGEPVGSLLTRVGGHLLEEKPKPAKPTIFLP